MTKKPAPRAPEVLAAEDRFRDWCKRKIAADPRYAHVIVEDMVALYGGSGERHATADAVSLLAHLGRQEREAEDKTTGAEGGRETAKKNKAKAAAWHDLIDEAEVRRMSDAKLSASNIARRIVQESWGVTPETVAAYLLKEVIPPRQK